MVELFNVIESWAQDVLPSFFVILGVSLLIVFALLFILSKTETIVREFKPLWYVQAILLVVVILAAKSLVLSTFDLDAESRKLVDQVSMTILWLLGAVLANQALDLFVWNGIFLKNTNPRPRSSCPGWSAPAFTLSPCTGS